MDDELKLYDTDPAAWPDQQADALRRRAANEVDWDNVAEEIEHLSRSDRREIRSRLQTGLTDLPAACPWTIEQVLDGAFWP